MKPTESDSLLMNQLMMERNFKEMNQPTSLPATTLCLIVRPHFWMSLFFKGEGRNFVNARTLEGRT